MIELTRERKKNININTDEPGLFDEDLCIDPNKRDVFSTLRSAENSSLGINNSEDSAYEDASEYENDQSNIMDEISAENAEFE